MFWKTCIVCNKIEKMNSEVCSSCQKEIFRCLLCDKIVKKKNGYKICRDCLQSNPFLCPVCLETKNEKDFTARTRICKECKKLHLPEIYPDYIETEIFIKERPNKKLDKLKEVMKEMSFEIKDISIYLGVSRAKVYSWLYDKRAIDVSLGEIEKMRKII